MEEVNSYIIYSSFFKATNRMNAEDFKEFWLALNDYATQCIEPDFEDNILQSALFEVIKPQIDANRRKKEVGIEGGKKGGRPKKQESVSANQQIESENYSNYAENNEIEQKTEKTIENAENNENRVLENKPMGYEEKRVGFSEKKVGFLDEKGRVLEKNPNVNVNVNDNVNVNENVNENDNANENLNVNANLNPPLEFSPYEKDYAEQIYKLWHENGLKEARGGLITFIQKDFKLAIPKIRQQKIHSSDLFKAIENYAEVVHKAIRKGISWFESDVFFDSFCSESIIQRFLPERYEVSGLDSFIMRSKTKQGVSAIDNGTYKPNYDAEPEF